MLTQDDARALAKKHVSELGADLVLLSNPIACGDYGWVFGYQRAEYLQKNNLIDALAGNAPLLVERGTGKIHTLGTAHPMDNYIESFLKFGDPHRTD
ncbi:YrhB domain-containing protein [Roseobacter sp. MH60115]|uniref:YrhB domain-containing protein n=1 Tax=Roseobacter sp. MH60115 TaxID=2785324 RepID=UPI0018A2CF28|nr:YrhB domain-containing protein [Roseobacter sp. MH60115]